VCAVFVFARGYASGSGIPPRRVTLLA